jgi:hypothetical protein
VKEAIARNDNAALHHLLGDSLWPLMVAKGVDLRKLRTTAVEQRWAAGQTVPGSGLQGFLCFLCFLCGDGEKLGQTSYSTAVVRSLVAPALLAVSRLRLTWTAS